MRIEDILTINNVSKINLTPGSVLAIDPSPMVMDRISKLIGNDLILVKEHAIPLAKYIATNVEARFDAMKERVGVKEPTILYMDVPQHINDINGIHPYTDVKYDLSNISGISIQWRDEMYDDIFMATIKPHDVLYAEFRSSIPRSEVKRVWGDYIGGQHKDGSVNAFISLSNPAMLTKENINDIFILDILGKGMATNTTMNATHDITNRLTVLLRSISTRAIHIRLKAIDSMVERITPVYAVSEEGNCTITSKAGVMKFIAEGGDIETLKHITAIKGGVDYSTINIIKHAEEFSKTYTEKYDKIKLTIEQGMQTRLTQEYVQAVTESIKTTTIDKNLMNYDNNTLIADIYNHLNSMEYMDIYEIYKTCLNLTIELFYKGSNVKMLTDLIMKYTSKGINLNTATEFAIEDMVIKYIGTMYTVE